MKVVSPLTIMHAPTPGCLDVEVARQLNHRPFGIQLVHIISDIIFNRYFDFYKLHNAPKSSKTNKNAIPVFISIPFLHAQSKRLPSSWLDSTVTRRAVTGNS